MYNDRMPGYYTGDVTMPMKRHNKFYSEREKYKQLLASQENRRRRRHNRRSNYDDIVKTGSEDENERPYYYRKRTIRRKSMQKRDDELIASIERRERIILSNYMENKKLSHFLSPKDIKDKRHGSPPRSTRSGKYTSDESSRIHEYKPLVPDNRLRPLSSQSHQFYTGHMKPAFERVHGREDENERDARYKRTSMLNRVEQYIDSRKGFTTNGEHGRNKTNATYRVKKKYVKKPEDSDSDDGTYVFVNPSVTPDIADITSDLDHHLPPITTNSTEPQRMSRISEITLPSVVKSEIQVLGSDDDVDSARDQRPLTDTQTYRGHPVTLGNDSRFVSVNDNHKPKPKMTSEPFVVTQQSKGDKGRRVTFYKNNDKNFKGLTLNITKKSYANLGTLIDYLNKKITVAPFGIKFIYPLPDGPVVESVDQLEHTRSYIVCGAQNPVRTDIRYGYVSEKAWIIKQPSAGKIRKSELAMFKSDTRTLSPKNQGRVITIYDNINKNRKEKVILNPQTEQTFDQILSDMGDMFKINATGLYMRNDPSKKVHDFSDLFGSKFRNVEEFIICGPELVPSIDLSGQKRLLPSSNSSNDSVSGALSSRQKKMQKSSNFDENKDLTNGLDESPTPSTDDTMRWEEDSIDLVGADIESNYAEDEKMPQTVTLNYRIKGKQRAYFKPTKDSNELEADLTDTKPRRKLLLEWVYGFRSSESNDGLMLYQRTGEIVCYVDAVVVFYNSSFDSQRHYLAHTEEVTCMAIHPDGKLIATGQKAGKEPENAAHVRVWDGKTLSTQHIIGVGIFTRGVVSVNFSVHGESKDRNAKLGKKLCAVDSSEKHVLTVWDWEKKRLLGRTTTSTKKVTYACFWPPDDTIVVTYGEQHLYFWKLFWDSATDRDGRIMRDRESGQFPDTDQSREVTSITFSSRGDAITGDTTGSILVWAVDNSTWIFKYDSYESDLLQFAHTKPVTSLCLLPDGITLISGGGNEIKAWDTSNAYAKMKERTIGETNGSVTVILPHNKSKTTPYDRQPFYVGTDKACILEGFMDDKLKKHLEAHYDAVWSLVAHPKDNVFYSASHDSTVRKWSADRQRLLWSKRIGKHCTCIDINPKGNCLAVGTLDGCVFLLDAQARDESPIYHKISTDSVEVVKFSPERDMLAVGLDDGSVYIYDKITMTRRFDIRHNRIFKANSSPVVNIDWESSTHSIQTMTNECDIFHWDVTDMVCSAPELMCDRSYATFTALVGYQVAGMWSNLKVNEEIKLCSRNMAKDYIAAGDNMGRIRIYKFPCILNKPPYKSTRVYSSGVTAMCFLSPQGKLPEKLISCGGQKSVLAQWVMEPS